MGGSLLYYLLGKSSFRFLFDTFDKLTVRLVWEHPSYELIFRKSCITVKIHPPDDRHNIF